MALERFGVAMEVVESDGFKIELRFEIEGSKPITMTKTIGLGIIEFSSRLTVFVLTLFLSM